MSPAAWNRLLKLYNGRLRIIGSSEIPDFVRVKRTWAERLFTLPWRPLVATKLTASSVCYATSDGSILVSLKTKEMICDALLSENYPAHSE